MSFSKWRWVCIALGETYEAIVGGMQSAFWYAFGEQRRDDDDHDGYCYAA